MSLPPLTWKYQEMNSCGARGSPTSVHTKKPKICLFDFCVIVRAAVSISGHVVGTLSPYWASTSLR